MGLHACFLPLASACPPLCLHACLTAACLYLHMHTPACYCILSPPPLCLPPASFCHCTPASFLCMPASSLGGHFYLLSSLPALFGYTCPPTPPSLYFPIFFRKNRRRRQKAWLLWEGQHGQEEKEEGRKMKKKRQAGDTIFACLELPASACTLPPLTSCWAGGWAACARHLCLPACLCPLASFFCKRRRAHGFLPHTAIFLLLPLPHNHSAASSYLCALPASICTLPLLSSAPLHTPHSARFLASVYGRRRRRRRQGRARMRHT